MKNREIKFRAWDLSNEKMIPPRNIIGLEGETSKECPNDLILKEFTGLKDKNGIDIYEDDILDIQFQNRYFKVIKNYASFDVQSETKQYPLNDIPNDEIEVIGNTYEDPKLMKQ